MVATFFVQESVSSCIVIVYVRTHENDRMEKNVKEKERK